jgi:5-methylcytosine-specific restriction endonuclease McrA
MALLSYMNSNQRDKKLFRLTVETLRDELRASSEGTPIRCVGRLKIRTNYVGGWCCVVAGLGRGQPKLELWLDHYPSRQSRRFYFGFYCSKKTPIKRLISIAPDYLKPKKTLTSKDFERVRAGFWSLTNSFGTKDYAARYFEEYYGRYYFFGVYDPQKPKNSKIARSVARKALAFFEEVIQNAPSVKVSQPRYSEFPRIENRSFVSTHISRERSPVLSRQCKIRDNFRCQVCGMKFENIYGELGEEFAEAHHKKPLSHLVGAVKSTPDDLVTVCANCHRMLHRMDGKPEDIVRLKAIILKHRKHNRR